MAVPPCRQLGQQCRALDVTLRVAALEGDEDHDGTWLMGHTERIDFGGTFEEDDELWCAARLHVPCKYLEPMPGGATSRCRAHGYVGKVPQPARLTTPRRRQGADTFELMEKRRMVTRRIPLTPIPTSRRALPVAAAPNPCASARCRTADNRVGAACCRDLQIQIRVTPRQRMLDALVRSRKAPYLCKIETEEEDNLLNVEILSACSYLQEDGITCDLHGRFRADGRPAKPIMCSAWPEKRSGLHPGCAFRNTRLKL